MSKKVVTFGEIMMRLQTPGYQRFVQAGSLEMIFGGERPMSLYPLPTMALPHTL